MRTDARYGIAELAELGGVSRRTVRYYVQEGLLPAPYGRGRGPHYGQPHLEQLLRVKTLQEAGKPLDEIRMLVARRAASAAADPAPAPIPRTPWTRIVLAPGLELHVASGIRIPGPGRLADLAAWCQHHFHRPEEDSHA